MANSNSLSQQEILDIAQEAFIYGLPLVLVEITRLQSYKNDEPRVLQFSNQNAFCHPMNKL